MNRAFTLAEVLITLGIIGVIAAMTIPVMISNYQKTQTLTQLKRTFNVISNALRMAIAENGDPEGWSLNPSNNIQASSDFANMYLIPYLHVIKNCGTDTSGVCSYEPTAMNGSPSDSVARYSRFFLNDGTLVLIRTTVNQPTDTFPMLVEINVDLNGLKKPNKAGRDYFLFSIALVTTDDMYRPTGRLNAAGQTQTRDTIINPTTSASCTRTGNGGWCAALIIKDGWQITNDYPW